MLSTQNRIMSHLMSLEECDIGINQKITSNPRSPSNVQKFDGMRPTVHQDRSDNDSIQLAATGCQPPSTVQQQYQHDAD